MGEISQQGAEINFLVTYRLRLYRLTDIRKIYTIIEFKTV